MSDSNKLKFVDFFAGCGGFRTAFEREGFECVAFCEIDKHATKLYKAYYNTENEVYYNDATTVEPEHMPDFDIFTGGFPCQAFSIAGKRQGFEDARGTLFFEIARICKVKQPKYIVLENVKGLLNHDNGRTFATILRVLSDIGYRVEWQVLNSKFFGVPQNRERVFIVGHLRTASQSKIFPIREADEIHLGANEDKEEIYNIASTMTARQYASWNGNFIYQRPRGKNEGGLKDIAPTVSANSYEHNNLLVGTLRRYKDSGGFRAVKEQISPCVNARAREDGDMQPVIALPIIKRGGAVLYDKAVDSFRVFQASGIPRRYRKKGLRNWDVRQPALQNCG